MPDGGKVTAKFSSKILAKNFVKWYGTLWGGILGPRHFENFILSRFYFRNLFRNYIYVHIYNLYILEYFSNMDLT